MDILLFEIKIYYFQHLISFFDKNWELALDENTKILNICYARQHCIGNKQEIKLQ